MISSKYEANVKVVRVCLDNGERLIGFQFPQLLMPHAERESKAMAQERGVGDVTYIVPTYFWLYCRNLSRRSHDNK